MNEHPFALQECQFQECASEEVTPTPTAGVTGANESPFAWHEESQSDKVAPLPSTSSEVTALRSPDGSSEVSALRSPGRSKGNKMKESRSVTFKENDDPEDIMAWLEIEVKERLLLMDAKLDMVGNDVGRFVKFLDEEEKSSRVGSKPSGDSLSPKEIKRIDNRRRASVTASEHKLNLELMKHRRNSDRDHMKHRREHDEHRSRISVTAPRVEEINGNKTPNDLQQQDSALSGLDSVEDVVPLPENQPTPLPTANHVIDAGSPPPRTTQISEAFTRPGSLLSHSTSAWENDSDIMYPSPSAQRETAVSQRETTFGANASSIGSVVGLPRQISGGRKKKREGKRFSTLNLVGMKTMVFDDSSRWAQYKESIWNFLDDMESSRAAAYNATAMQGFLLLAFFASLFRSGIEDDDTMDSFKTLMAAVDIVVDIVCIIEVTIRFSVSPNKCHFCGSTYAWIDFLAAYPPLIIRAAVGWTLPENDSFAKLSLVCVVPILRLCKILRHFEQLRLLLNAFELAFEALPVLLYMLLMITLLASAGVYSSEPRDNVETLPDAIWMSVVTVATVGYGDLYPVTVGGKLCIVALIVVSVLYMAAPLGIIGSAFEVVWRDRDRILLMQKTRDRLLKWGYSPEDIPLLFEMADSDNTGEVDIHEFRGLIRNMKIGLSDERIAMLFNSFDEDGSGAISSKEFIRYIFPNHYLELFRDEIDSRSSWLSASAHSKNTSIENHRGSTQSKVARAPDGSRFTAATCASRFTTATTATAISQKEMTIGDFLHDDVNGETLHESGSTDALDECLA